MKTRTAKRSRTRRSQPRLIEITDRDDALLILTGISKYLASDQIARALFPSADRCLRRLRALFDAGYLSTTLQSSTKPNLISLTRQGLNFVEGRHPELVGDLRLAGPLRLAGIEHHLAVVDARIYAAALGDLRQAPLTRWSNAGGKLHRELSLEAVHLIPDAIAEFTSDQGPIFIAIEVDCSTSTLGTLQKKLSRYQPLAENGVLDALWFVMVGGVQRQHNLSQLIGEAGLSEWARVLPHRHLLERPVRELPER